jgi:hypothetical protein
LVPILLLVTAVPSVVAAQRGGFRGSGAGWRGGSDFTVYNVPYDGRFTFARLSFTPTSQGGWGRGRGRQLYWDHDWPIAETNLLKLLRELTDVRPFMEGTNILAADDPELFKYPVAYVSEPGHWMLSEAEAEGLRNYLLKGGFLIFDDFADEYGWGAYEWGTFEHGMLQVLPEARPVQLDLSHPIFHSFFEIDSLELQHPYRYVYAEFWGIYEDNDPDKRLLAIINYNADIGDYWEYSDMGFYPIPLSNEAYKLGVNYIIYAMTH